jgi:hypothetical protein
MHYHSSRDGDGYVDQPSSYYYIIYERRRRDGGDDDDNMSTCICAPT